MGGRLKFNSVPRWCATVADLVAEGATVRTHCNTCGQIWDEDLSRRDPAFSFVGVREACRHCGGVCGHRAVAGGGWPPLLSEMDPAMIPAPRPPIAP